MPMIIDGPRGVVTGFYQDHHEKDWYREAFAYLIERRAFVQKRFVECMRFVGVYPENSKTFSYEFASILRDCGSVFSSVLDSVIKGSKFANKSKTTIVDYRKFLKSQDPTIYLSSVHFRSRFPDGLILPLYSWKEAKNPRWWSAYNEVKHSEYKTYYSGNLGNAATALASLIIIEAILGNPKSDEIWTNVGREVVEDSYDMRHMKRLFPESE